jgi:serine/threonine protein kinase
LVFKIIGVDGVWYIVKVFYVKEFAEHEWSALKIVMGKHPSLQQGIALQTEREGDNQHIIMSCYQGDIVLSKVRDSIYLLNLQQIIWMFLELSKGIKKLHELGILHCDIKPDNLILSYDSEGRLILNLIDFGIAEKIGKETRDPQSHYTWWYRDLRLFLDYFMRSFNTKMSTFVEPVTLSRVMDWRAFFITFLHAVSEKSNDFLGFRSTTEGEARKHMILTSCVPQLILRMKPFLGGDNRCIDFVRQIYFVLLNKEGAEKFVEIFNSVGLKLTGTGTHDEYLKMFNRLRDNHPMIEHVRNVFKHVRCDDKQLDISGPMNNLIDLFVEILRDGADLSLLGCLTMDHIQRWLDRLTDSLHELCRLGSKIFFY